MTAIARERVHAMEALAAIVAHELRAGVMGVTSAAQLLRYSVPHDPIAEKSLGPEHPEIAVLLNELARLLRSTNRPAEAEPLVRRALAINEKIFGIEGRRVIWNSKLPRNTTAIKCLRKSVVPAFPVR